MGSFPEQWLVIEPTSRCQANNKIFSAHFFSFFIDNPSIHLLIGHLHDGVILLLRPESFSFFLSYSNLVPVRFRKQKP